MRGRAQRVARVLIAISGRPKICKVSNADIGSVPTAYAFLCTSARQSTTSRDVTWSSADVTTADCIVQSESSWTETGIYFAVLRLQETRNATAATLSE